MKILSIYPHYRPDSAAYARILSAILEHLSHEGHVVHVLTAQPRYNDIRMPSQPRREVLDGVHVQRVRLLPSRKKKTLLRGFNFLWFMLRAITHVVCRRDYDLIIANTYPPVLIGITLRLIRWLTGTPYIYHCQDIHPESSAVARKLTRSRMYEWLRGLDARACEKAALVVVLSDDMQKTLVARGRSGRSVRVQNNFVSPVDEAQVNKVPPLLGNDEDQFVVFFAGNMGSFQGLGRIVTAFGQLTDEPRLRLVFMGGGDQQQALERQAGSLVGSTIHFLPYHPTAVAFACMQKADLGLVALRPDIYRVAYPSKSMMYLAAGCPLLAVLEPASALSRTVRDHGIGYAVSDDSPETIAATIRQAFADKKSGRFPTNEHVLKKSTELFGLEKALQTWTSFVADATNGPDMLVLPERKSLAPRIQQQPRKAA